MRRTIWALAVVLAACSGAPADSPSTSTSAQAPSAAVTPTPSPQPTPSPTPEPAALEPEIVAFAQIGDSLSVRIHNPNATIGLVRTPFELALLDASGALISVEGTSGLPGAPCCTIYQLPPGGDFGLNLFLAPDSAEVASLELTIPGDPWIDWASIEPPTATLTELALTADFSVSVTGRIAIDDIGPHNAWIVAFADTPAGQLVIADGVQCMVPGEARAFEITAFGTDSIEATLTEAIAYTTTVEGHTGGFTPTC